VKILVPMHIFNNFGGIINHTEELIAGLRDLGHEVSFCLLKPTANLQKGEVDKKTLPEGYEYGVGTQVPVHQGKGWITDYFSFKNKDSIKKFVDFANQHDIVIWQSIFGFKNQDTEDFTDWTPMIEDVNAKQVVIIHDGNLKKLYSWIYKFQHKFSGVACVHPSAFKSADFLEVPRNMILNPQNIDGIVLDVEFSERENSILSLQTFKRWKRVDDLVAAVPYINADVILAGDGIERNYMTSKDKCKEEYFCSPERDPDASEAMRGNPIWKNAEATGRFEYLGFITGKKRDQYLEKVKFLIDTSWSNSYGEHFNRVVVDAMRMGVVPIARNFGVSSNKEGIGELLKPNENYLMIPHDATPKQFGDLVNMFMRITERGYNKIVQNNLELIKQFDRKLIAQQYINLALGKPNSGFYQEAAVGSRKFDQKAIQQGDKIWEEHFEKPVVNTLESFFD